MFELGKKDESGKDVDKTSGTGQRQGYSAPSTASASSETARREAAVIGRSIRIDGDLQGEEDLRIEGDVNGTVRLRNHTLTIGSEGKIRADVYAKSVVVDGLMEGDLYGSERVAIRQNATVLGNITSPRVSLDDGARFKGSIEMDPETVKAAVGTSVKASSGTDVKPKQNGSDHAAKPKPVPDEAEPARKSVG